jgi:hypothetical protein
MRPHKAGIRRLVAIKNTTFRGDDGIEFISIEEIEGLAAAPPTPGARPQYLAIATMPEQLTLTSCGAQMDGEQRGILFGWCNLSLKIRPQ